MDGSLCEQRIHSLDTLYRQEHRRIFAYLAAQIGCESADDLAQEVFLRAARSPHLLELENPAGFLHRIARNLLIDHLRKRRCRGLPVALCDSLHLACEPEQETILAAQQADAIYRRTIASLPERTARIFTMSRVERKTYREISRSLAITTAAVEYHMMRALTRLRVNLAEAACQPGSGRKI